MSSSRPFYICCLLVVILASAGCRQDPNRAKRRFVENGDKFAAEQQYPEAIIEYSRALQVDPNFSVAHEALGKVYVATGNKLNAWQSYQRAALNDPENTTLQIQAGGVLLLAHRFDDARTLAEGVLKRDPKNVNALVLRANSLAGLENIDAAITMVNEAIRLDPSASELYSNLASLMATSGQLQEAEQTYLKAVEVAPRSANSHLPLGQFYWATGRIREAEQAFRKAVEVEPANQLAHRALATFYLGALQPLKAEASLKFLADLPGELSHRLALADYYVVTGRKAQGEAIFQELVKNPDAEARARTRLVALAWAEGKRAVARSQIEDVLVRFPSHAPAILLKARFTLAAGGQAEALRLAIEATKVQPGFVEALYLVGQLQQQDGDLFDAADAYKSIIRANPFSVEAQIQLSRVLLMQGERETSREVMSRLLRRAPRDQQTRLSLVRALLERGDLEVAEIHLKALVAQAPRSAVIQSLMGTLYALKKDYPTSRRWFEAARRLDPKMVDPVSGLVGLDLTANRPADATARAELVSAANPRNVQLLLLLAKTYAAAHALPKAEATLRKAIELTPDNLEAYGMLGQLLYQSNRLAEGRAEFEKLLERRPRSVPAHTMVAIIYRREGKTEEAIERYKRALEIDPTAAVAANNLAWIYAERGVNLDEARILARAARKKLPDSAEIGDTLGWVYYRNGAENLLKLAVPLLEESVQKAPKAALFRYHLGAAYAKSGRTVDARRELQEALKLDDKFLGAAECRRLLQGLV